jgi:hypothetical protein
MPRPSVWPSFTRRLASHAREQITNSSTAGVFEKTVLLQTLKQMLQRRETKSTV